MVRAVAGDTTTALAAQTGVNGQGSILWDPDREGRFVFDASDVSAKVSADVNQGLYVAPASAPTGASGAWVRRFGNAPVNPRWFGLDPDNTGAENNAAWAAMVATLRLLAQSSHTGDPTGFYRTGFRIRFPDDQTYLFSDVIDVEGLSLWIEGVGPPTRYSGTRLLWANTSHGFNVDYGNSAASGTGGTWSSFSNLLLEGGYAGGAEAERHAIKSSDRIRVERCVIKNWAGDGIYVQADSPTGNANNGYVGVCSFENVRNGLYIDGADANNFVSIGNDYGQCRQWGEWHSEFLGAAVYMAQTADCGITQYNNGTTVAASVVSNGGHRYYLIDAAGSTNAPTGAATSNAWWGYLNSLGAGDGAPAWFSGMSVRLGGSFYVDNDSAAVTISNPYCEGGQPPARFGGRTVVLGGQVTDGVVGSGVWLRNAAGAMTTDYLDINTRFRTYGADTVIGPATGADGFLHLQSPVTGILVQWEQAGNIRGYDYCTAAAGRVVRGEAGVTVKHGATDVVTWTTAGANLASGVYKVAGTQVVGAQGAAVAADATDLATAITLVNQLKARIRAHGLVA